MKAEHVAFDTPHMQAAMMELQGLIRQHYPDTTCEVVHGDDPAGIYVLATVDGGFRAAHCLLLSRLMSGEIAV
jgi:hypothetical protein